MNTTNQVRHISHEIRNNLSICELYTEIIRLNLEKEGIQNSSIDNAIKCIQKSLKIMANNLIDLKSTGNVVLANYDLRTILEDSIKLSRVYAQDKKIKFIQHINESAVATLDNNKFTGCIVNIIKNAVEAIKDQGIIKINLIINPEKAIIQICNNGEMIPLEKQGKLFEEGYTTKSTGSGLGLFICRENLRLQNCNLKFVKSTPEETVFEVEIPL